MQKTRIVILSGAGMSAESGIKTFRDHDGLWEGHDVMEVASPEGFSSNPALVLEFYNQRRRNGNEAEPNQGHYNIAKLEEQFHVDIITQNVDDLHERAGSTNVYHLHGMLNKVKSTIDENYSIEWREDLVLGDLCPKGGQLRPDIVWFGEAVPMMDIAGQIARQADYFVVIGTSLQVYPAAGLIHYTDHDIPKFLIDPKIPEMNIGGNIEFIEKGASEGTKELLNRLMQ